jgi:hypothetical protein
MSSSQLNPRSRRKEEKHEEEDGGALEDASSSRDTFFVTCIISLRLGPAVWHHRRHIWCHGSPRAPGKGCVRRKRRASRRLERREKQRPCGTPGSTGKRRAIPFLSPSGEWTTRRCGLGLELQSQRDNGPVWNRLCAASGGEKLDLGAKRLDSPPDSPGSASSHRTVSTWMENRLYGRVARKRVIPAVPLHILHTSV